MKLGFSRIGKGLFIGAAGWFIAFQACGFPTNAVQAQQKSAIQLELEKLYQQDQREMPDMRLEALPKHTPDGVIFQNAPAPAQQVEPTPPRKESLLNKLPWFRKPAVEAQNRPRVVAPQQPQQTPQQSPSRYQMPSQGAPNTAQQPGKRYQVPSNATRAQQVFGEPQRPQSQPPAFVAQPFIDDDDDDDDEMDARQPQLLRQPVAPQYVPPRQFSQDGPEFRAQPTGVQTLPQINPLSREPQTGIFQNEPRSAPPMVLPAESFAPAPVAVERTAAPLPDLDAIPETPIPLIPAETAAPAAPTNPLDFFPDPFTDVSETEADVKTGEKNIPMLDVAMPPAETPLAAESPVAPETKTPTGKAPEMPLDDDAAPSAEENPFSGLKLDPPVSVEPAVAPPAETRPSQPEAALPRLDPAFADEFELPKKPAPSDARPDLPKLERIPEATLPRGEQGEIGWDEETARRDAKLRLIAERAGETGLKGFCIVSLRDKRDLTDALPAFRSTHNLRTYHFANLESKIEFDKDPLKYVPAYDGHDAILMSTQSEEREGSLDHALWFRGRLYLFTTAENKEIFQRDPALFAAH